MCRRNTGQPRRPFRMRRGSFDVYLKKLMIEKIIDELNSSRKAGGKEKSKNKE